MQPCRCGSRARVQGLLNACRAIVAFDRGGSWWAAVIGQRNRPATRDLPHVGRALGCNGGLTQENKPLTSFVRQLPLHFFEVRYDGSQIPAGDYALGRGANCQRFAYAVLRHFGVRLPPYRSSDLWADRVHTSLVDGPFEQLDLLLFAGDNSAYGAHVGLWTGADGVLHLSKSVGLPAIWSLDQFAERMEYRVMIGAKRVRTLFPSP